MWRLMTQTVAIVHTKIGIESPYYVLKTQAGHVQSILSKDKQSLFFCVRLV